MTQAIGVGIAFLSEGEGLLSYKTRKANRKGYDMGKVLECLTRAGNKYFLNCVFFSLKTR